MGKNEYGKYIAIGAVAAAVCLFVMKFDFLLGVLSAAVQAAAPLLLGCAIAYVVNIPLKGIEKFYFPGAKSRLVTKTRRPVCIVLSFAFLAAAAFLVMNLVIPELVSSIRLMTVEIPPLLERLWAWAVVQFDELPTLQDYLENTNINWHDMAKKALNILATGAGGLFNSVITFLSLLFGTVVKVLIASIFAIYLLSAKENLKRQAERFMQAYWKPERRRKVCYVVKTIHDTFTSFIVGQCVEAVIIGTLCAVLMMVLRMPYAVMTGTVVGATALIPVVGAYIGAAVGAFMVFTVNPVQALAFIVFLILLQQVEGNMIYPKVVGSSIGLPGLWVLAAVTVGGGVLGIPGMLIGVPLTASAYKLFQDAVAMRLGEKEKI